MEKLKAEIDALAKKEEPQVTKRLFSIYKTKWLSKEGNSNTNDASRPSTAAQGKDGQAQRYMTQLHYYKRDLTPVKENFLCFNTDDKTPYKSNFQNYEGSLLSKTFKDEMISSLGTGVKCVSSNSKNRSI